MQAERRRDSQQRSRSHGALRRADAGAAAVRLHDLLPHHLPGLHHRARQLPRRARRRCGSTRAAACSSPLFNYWKKIFALSFGMGVVSGIVMSYQFGTNWSVFSDKTGPVLGPLMGYEVLTAFFLEAGFLGVMLFGMRARRQGPAFLRHADGGGRHAHVRLLDPVGQQLDADARRLRHQRRRPVRPDRLVGGDLQPVVSLPPRAHGAGRLPHHRLRGRRGRRLPSAARPRATRARA